MAVERSIIQESQEIQSQEIQDDSEDHNQGAYRNAVTFEKFSLNFSISLLVIRVNLLHPWPSWFLYGLFSIISGVFFFYLCKASFSGFPQFKGNFVDDQNDSKLDCAPSSNVTIPVTQRMMISQIWIHTCNCLTLFSTSMGLNPYSG